MFYTIYWLVEFLQSDLLDWYNSAHARSNTMEMKEKRNSYCVISTKYNWIGDKDARSYFVSLEEQQGDKFVTLCSNWLML